MTLGQRISLYRKKLNISQEELGARLGVSRQAVSKWETDLKFVVPKEGSNWFVDAMCVLKTAQHKEEAEAWINFIASTESNLANMDYIGYASPNLEALEGYPAYYEETYGEPLDEERYEIMAAPDDVLARCELYTNLPADTLTLYNDLWTELGI